MDQAEMDRLLRQHIESLGLELKITNRLESVGIFTVEELLNCCSGLVECERCSWNKGCNEGRTKLMDIPNFGIQMLHDVYDALRRIGFGRTGG